jgi:NTE family protein
LLPSITEVVINSIDIMQARICAVRVREKPADAVIMPKVSHLGLLEYHRAREAIAQGTRCGYGQ